MRTQDQIITRQRLFLEGLARGMSAREIHAHIERGVRRMTRRLSEACPTRAAG